MIDFEIDLDIGSQLDQRYSTLTTVMLEEFTPVARQIEQVDSQSALVLLDTEIGNITNLFDQVLGLNEIPFQGVCDLLKQLNKYFNMRGLYREQVEWAQGLLAYFVSYGSDPNEKIDLVVLNIIASGFDALGEHADALDIYDFMIELYADEPFHPGLGVVCFNAALSYYRTGDIEHSLALCQRTIEIEQHHNNPYGTATALMLLADLFHEMNDIPGIFQALRHAIDLIEPLNNRYLHAQITGKLALHMARYHNWERAASLFEAVIAEWREIGDDEQLAGTLFNYAILLHETGRHIQSIKLAEESLNLFNQYNLFHAQQVEMALTEWKLLINKVSK